MLWWHFNAWSGQNCSLQFAWKEEGGRKGQKWEDAFYNPSLLIFSLHVIPAKAENNEQQAAGGGESQVQPWTPPLEGSIGLDELRLRWLPGCRVTSVSVIHCDADVDFFFYVSHLYLFQRMSPSGLHTSKHAELPNECEMCVFPKMCKT